MSESAPLAVTPLLPVTLPQGQIRYAPGMRAGPWIFATGHKAVHGYCGRIADEVLCTSAPHRDRSKLYREAALTLRNVEGVLRAGGSDLEHVVRVDQNYTSGRAVEAYHDARREILKDHIPPSTSTLVQGLILPGQDIEVNAIAMTADAGVRPQHIRPPQQLVHHTSGYSLALTAGDFVFVAGRMADSFTFGEGLAKEARVPPGHLWKGLPIKLETEFIVREKIVPALEAAGSSLDNVVKCQVYLRDVEDFAPFNEVWRTFFPLAPPATTLIPTATPGFFLEDAHIEINTIAVRNAGTTTRQVIAAGTTPAYAGYTEAVRAGNLVFLSGLMPTDEDGLVSSARIDPTQPWFGSSIREQMRALLSRAEEICEAAGTSLRNIVRIQQYHTDFADFDDAYRVWDEYLPGQYLPFTAVKVPYLPVPGCCVQLDLWVYAP
jgi:enamine deaminase RidA (YjgF/YER057c/UK114 family)